MPCTPPTEPTPGSQDAPCAPASAEPTPAGDGWGCLEVTLRHIRDGVIVTDGQGRVTLLNPVAESLTGWTTYEAGGERLAHVFPVVGGVTSEPLSLTPGGPDEGALAWTAAQFIDRQGRRHPVSVRSAAIPGATGQTGAVLIIRD